MLVLTRKMNESVYIDGEIEVMVVSVRGNKVRLGFRAPADVSIQRKERADHDEPENAFAGVHEVDHHADHREDDLVALHFGGARMMHARPR
ncbi:MAG TPA: carbon storage regulator [Planctomycetaceae bacterium]|jgi:carbon storage regulator